MHIDLPLIFTIERYSHYFKVIVHKEDIVGLLIRYSQQYIEMGVVREPGQKPRMAAVRKYFMHNPNMTEWRFVIGQYEGLMRHIEDSRYFTDRYQIIDKGVNPVNKVNIKVRDNWVLRSEQEEAREFALAPNFQYDRIRLLAMPTGTGKTVTSSFVVADRGYRTVFMVKAQYVNKWIKDIEEIYDVKKGDILVVKGSDALKCVIDQAIHGELKAKFIIISLTTYQLYMKLYEHHGDDLSQLEYNCTPDDFYATIGAGTALYDEVHESLHAVFMTMLHTNVDFILSLSATVISRDPVKSKVQSAMFPKVTRFTKIEMKKYIHVYPIGFSFKQDHLPRIKITEYGSTTYSQVAYEQSIIRNKHILHNYLEMVSDLADMVFVESRAAGDRLAIYAGRVEMCDLLLAHMKRKFPHLTVRRYCQKDPYDNVMSSDIVVTNLIKAGAALDITDLTTVIMTNSIRSDEANLQVLGRLRELKDGRKTSFYYFYCDQIKKHWDYHTQKRDLFRPKVATIKDMFYPHNV